MNCFCYIIAQQKVSLKIFSFLLQNQCTHECQLLFHAKLEAIQLLLQSPIDFEPTDVLFDFLINWKIENSDVIPFDLINWKI